MMVKFERYSQYGIGTIFYFLSNGINLAPKMEICIIALLVKAG